MASEFTKINANYKTILSKRNAYKDTVSTRKAKEEELVNMIGLDKIDIEVFLTIIQH